MTCHKSNYLSHLKPKKNAQATKGPSPPQRHPARYGPQYWKEGSVENTRLFLNMCFLKDLAFIFTILL